MSRRYNIRWREADEAELKRVVKNFNAKLTRLEKKDPSKKNALPDRVSAAQLRDMIQTRQDLNRELNSLRRFSERGAEEIVTAPDNYYNLELTKWQKDEMNRRAATINAVRTKRRKRLEEMEMKHKGQSLGYKVGDVGMDTVSKNELKPVKAFTKYQSRADLKYREKQLVRESQSGYWDRRDEGMRRGYINSIREHFAEDDVLDVIEAIENMDFQDFYNTHMSSASGFDITYPPRQGTPEYEEYLSALKSMWLPNE